MFSRLMLVALSSVLLGFGSAAVDARDSKKKPAPVSAVQTKESQAAMTPAAALDLLKQGIFFNRQMMFKSRTTRDLLLDHHRAINAALQARDAPAARAAIAEHLSYVESRMGELRRAEKNQEIARLRYAHETERG